MPMKNLANKDISTIKKELNMLVNEYCSLNIKSDNAYCKNLRNKIWCCLFDFFYTPAMTSKIKNQFKNISEFEQEDILNECIHKGFSILDKYNENNKSGASFTTFLEKSITNFLFDYHKKNTKSENIIYYDSYINDNENDNLFSSLEKNTELQTNDSSNLEEANIIFSYLQEFSNTIIEFLNHQGKKNNAVRKLYYCVFYTETLISFIISSKSYNDDWFPSHILDAYLFTLSDYILINKCRTTLQIYKSKPHTYNDLLSNGNEKQLDFPLSAKILISYFDKIENKKISNANISQFRKEYKELLGNIINIF